MPIHVEDMTTEVEAFEGELPLSAAQLDRLVEMVIQRLEEKQRGNDMRQAITEIRSGSADL